MAGSVELPEMFRQTRARSQVLHTPHFRFAGAVASDLAPRGERLIGRRGA